MESRIQQLAQIGALSVQVGRRVQVLPHDEIIKLAQTDEICSLLVRRYRVREYRYQTCFDAAQLVLRTWTRTTSGWSEAEPIVLADADFQPFRRQEIGTVRDTPEAVREREAWEEICHRPGNGTRLGQRDSYYRALEGYSPGERVKNVWETSTAWSTDLADSTPE